MFATTIGNGGFQQQQPPVRQCMQGHVATIKNHVLNHIDQKVKERQPIYESAWRTLQGTQDGQQRLSDAIIGVVNYIDYLVNAAKQPADQAIQTAVIQCIDGFMSNIVLRSPFANQLDYGVRSQLNQAEQLLGQAIQLVNQHIAPAILQERQSGLGLSGGGLGGGAAQIRRTDNGFGGSGGGVNLIPSQTSSGSAGLFNSGAAPAGTSAGGGLDLGVDKVHRESPKPIQETPLEYTTPTYKATATTSSSSNKTNLVVYMEYEQHKTHGLLSAVLPSDAQRRIMPVVTVDNNFAAMAAVSQYTKLGSEVIRSDVSTTVGAGYALEQITVPSGQYDYSTMVNDDAHRALQLGRRELERLTFTGQLVQLFPLMDTEGRLKEVLGRYNQGLMTHGRLTSLVAEMEEFVPPESIAIISKKLADVASTYWRFNMQETAGEFTNYFEGHDGATEYLRREPNKGQAADAWAAFPAKVVHELLLSIPVQDSEGNEQLGLGFQVGYIRVPYYAVELPIGAVDASGSRADYGVVVRNATPGLYHLCQTLQEAYPGAAHKCIMTNEGRMLEVIKPMIGDTERFYIREMTRGLV